MIPVNASAVLVEAVGEPATDGERAKGDVASAEGVLAVAATLGLDRAALAAALQDEAAKQRLKDEVEAALDRGVFGSPFLFVDDEPFWGADRLEMVERWLSCGGW